MTPRYALGSCAHPGRSCGHLYDNAGEVLYGLTRLPEGKRRSALAAEAMSLFGQLVCLAVPEAAADQYAAIKRIGHNDTYLLNNSGLKAHVRRVATTCDSWHNGA